MKIFFVALKISPSTLLSILVPFQRAKMDLVASKERYALEEKIGQGAFGEVFRARDVLTGQVAAMKLARVAQEGEDEDSLPKHLLREVWALQLLRGSSHIAQLLCVFARGSALALVFDFAESDLGVVLRGGPVPEIFSTTWLRMLMSALETVHSVGMIHRDVKPSNLLVRSDGELLLGDFGQCRPATENADYTHQVSTRWYRAPELLFGARRYDAAVDIWGAAVVLAEMLSGRVTFPGNSDIEQLVLLFKVMGSPSPERWPSAAKLPDFDKICFNSSDPKNLEDCLDCGDALAASTIDLVYSIMKLEPAWRRTATAALGHPALTAVTDEDAGGPSSALRQFLRSRLDS